MVAASAPPKCSIAVGLVVYIGCVCRALHFGFGGALFVASSPRRLGGAGTDGTTNCRQSGRIVRSASGTASEPWKPLVFKMPKKKPPRVAAPGDKIQQYTLDMRERLKALKLKEEKAVGEERAVSETKIDDYIAKEADDAKINALYAMWYIDKTRDKIKEDTENPGVEALRERYTERLERLDGGAVDEPATPARGATDREAPKRRGFVELASVQNIDELIAQSPVRQRPKEKHKEGIGKAAMPFKLPDAQDVETASTDDGSDEGIAEYLEAVQRQSRRLDKASKRVFKSPEQRRQDYEDTKLAVTGSTAALGVVGTSVALASSGVNAAFSFAFGSVGALLYVSGLSQYADSAETPMGQAMGGRRLLVPVILVLTVANWEKLEYYFPALAASGLEPQLVPLLMGFFTYVLGKVIGGTLKF